LKKGSTQRKAKGISRERKKNRGSLFVGCGRKKRSRRESPFGRRKKTLKKEKKGNTDGPMASSMSGGKKSDTSVQMSFRAP